MEHSDLEDLMAEGVNGNTSLTAKKKGDVVTGQISSSQGDGTYKESTSGNYYDQNKLPKFRKGIKSNVNDFVKKNGITY